MTDSDAIMEYHVNTSDAQDGEVVFSVHPRDTHNR